MKLNALHVAYGRVHDTTKKVVEKAALFRRLALSVHTNTPRKRPSNREKLKMPSFRIRLDGKHFENGTFGKRCNHDNNVISLPGDWCVFKLLGGSVHGA